MDIKASPLSLSVYISSLQFHFHGKLIARACLQQTEQLLMETAVKPVR